MRKSPCDRTFTGSTTDREKWSITADRALVFVEFSDQRFYRLDGTGVDDEAGIRSLASGSHLLAFPRFSPDRAVSPGSGGSIRRCRGTAPNCG